MKTTTTGDRALSIAGALLFTGGALAVLLDDWLHGAPWTLKHTLTVITVAGTILAGHLASTAWRQRHIWGLFGFGLLFLAGTGLTVFSSVGRQAEQSFLTAADVALKDEARAASKKALAEADVMLADARKALAAECKSGAGKRCQGIQATIDVYAAAVKGHQADIERLGPQKVVAPDAERFAEIAAVFGADKAKVKAGAVLVVPFLLTLFLEFGSIISFGFAFRHGSKAVPANDNRVPVEVDDPEPGIPALEPIRDRDDPIICWSRAFAKRHGRVPSIPEVQQAFPGTPKTTAWRKRAA